MHKSAQAFAPIVLKQKKTTKCRLAFLRKWSGRRVSNPLPTAWKAVALPNELLPRRMWEGEDSNLRRLSQQIYSLPHLTALVPSQRADRRIRTADQLITNQLLYQLSYIGFGFLPFQITYPFFEFGTAKIGFFSIQITLFAHFFNFIFYLSQNQ